LAHVGYLDQVVRFSLFKTSSELSAVHFCSQQLNNAMKTRRRLYGEDIPKWCDERHSDAIASMSCNHDAKSAPIHKAIPAARFGVLQRLSGGLWRAFDALVLRQRRSSGGKLSCLIWSSDWRIWGRRTISKSSTMVPLIKIRSSRIVASNVTLQENHRP
jgi:hypothetical protein